MEKKSIIAIILVFVILFLSPLLFNKRKKIDKMEPAQKTEQVIEKKMEKPKAPIVTPKPSAKIIPGTITTVQTPLYEAQITSNGARLISWKLNDYRKRKNGDEQINLIPKNAQNCLAIKFHDNNIQSETEKFNWETDKKILNVKEGIGEQGTLEYKFTTSKGIEIHKKMTFHSDSYIVDVDISFMNPTGQSLAFNGYDLCWGDGLTEDELITPAELASEGPMVLMKTDKGPKIFKHWRSSRVGCFGGKQIRTPDGSEEDGPLYWVGFAGKYFTTVLIPAIDPWWSDSNQVGKRYKVKTGIEELSLPANTAWQGWGDSTTISLTKQNFALPIGNSQSHRYQAYIGPKKWSILRNVRMEDTSENLKLGKMVSFGFFTPVGKATLWLLQGFYKIGKNYGISIILISILIKLIYLPFTQKSYDSMNKMQELQPKLNEIKDQYRDNPQELNKKTMEVYKQYGASPFTGCLPLLLQIPVFWALFSTLRGAVELRDAVFISGWVNDLSLPDLLTNIAGFPIRILPLLMTGSSLAQQFVFGTGSPGQNNKMMAFMPLFMLFIFYNMPSGLVLYWLCNDVMTFAHRFYIKRQQDNKPITQIEDEGKSKNDTKNKSKYNSKKKKSKRRK